ncbi:MAG: hypothetical protein HYT72_00310 [Candidatus Aenigmarchaeota archaeon]|nr:hypothetical protein [Candidatus Aenigmarchaeota archaeon]
MVNETYLRQLGTGVASLTFGVVLSIFIYAAASGVLNSTQAFLLYGASFLLMLRFWWRYAELFIQFLPSRSFWHFLSDFAISFFGILAVLFVGAIQAWAALGATAMIASMIRCGLSWQDAKNEDVKNSLKRTLFGSVAMFIVMSVIYSLSPLADNVLLAMAAFAVVLIFVVYASVRA